MTSLAVNVCTSEAQVVLFQFFIVQRYLPMRGYMVPGSQKSTVFHNDADKHAVGDLSHMELLTSSVGDCS